MYLYRRSHYKLVRIVLFLSVLLLCMFLVSNSYANGSNSTEEGESHMTWQTLVKYTSSVLVGFIIVFLIVVRALNKSKRASQDIQPTAQQFEQSYFKEPSTKTVIDYLRSKSRQKFIEALKMMVNFPVYDTIIISELGKIISKQTPYDQYDWLDIDYQCRMCRLLHLAVERNRVKGDPNKFNVSYSSIFFPTKDSYCVINSDSSSFIKSFLSEIMDLVRK